MGAVLGQPHCGGGAQTRGFPQSQLDTGTYGTGKWEWDTWVTSDRGTGNRDKRDWETWDRETRDWDIWDWETWDRDP